MKQSGSPNVEEMKANQDIDGLIEALSYQKDPHIRLRATSALGDIGDPRAIEALCAVALDDRYESVRSNALMDIVDKFTNRLRADRDIPGLIKALSHRYFGARCGAASALGLMGHKRELPDIPLVVDSLLNFLTEDSDERVRGSAASALGRIGDPRAMEALCAAAVDDTEYVRIRAESAMVDIGYKHCVKLGAPVVKPLINRLDAYQFKEREAAAKALVALYQSGQLDEDHKQLILAQREAITRERINEKVYTDRERTTPMASDCTHEDNMKHEDAGIGVKFPV